MAIVSNNCHLFAFIEAMSIVLVIDFSSRMDLNETSELKLLGVVIVVRSEQYKLCCFLQSFSSRSTHVKMLQVGGWLQNRSLVISADYLLE